MLKREIKYEDFNGEQAVDIFYFNISKPELVELEVEIDGGLGAYLRNIVEAKDNKALIKEFKRIVLLAYGEKSPDGKRFIKNDQLREEFSQTAAYQSLFMELATEDEAASNFLLAVLPKDMIGEIEKALPAAPQAPQAPTPPTPPPAA